MVDTSAGLDQLYRQHQRWLQDWLRHKIGHQEQAADLVQDTFVKVLQTRDALVGVKEPRAYLTTIAKNLMLDQLRRKRIEQAYLDELQHRQWMFNYLPSVDEQIQVLQAIEQISHILEAVSDKAQQAFLQHYFEGKSHQQIAEQLGVSTRMVQKYLAQCLLRCHRLKQQYTQL